MTTRILVGDCRERMAELEPSSVDSIVTDPPYELGFMGKSWDRSGIAFDPETWAACLSVLKPGGHLLAFGGTRTVHRIACAIEDAGFEIRDQIAWLYGSGFPKSLDVSKAIDKAAGNPLAFQAFADAYRKAVQASPYSHADIDRHLGIKASSCFWERRDYRGGMPPRRHWERLADLLNLDEAFAALYDEAEREVIGRNRRGPGWFASQEGHDVTVPATEAAAQWDGWGTALKPAMEPIIVARKPLIGTVAANVAAHGTGALNIDGCRIGDGGQLKWAEPRDMGYHGGSDSGPVEATASSLGRWPANVVLDEAAAQALDAMTGELTSGTLKGSYKGGGTKGIYGEYGHAEKDFEANSGGASRFFFVATADSYCWLCDWPKHGTMSATKETRPCGRASSASGNSSQSWTDSDSVPALAQPMLLPSSEGSGPKNDIAVHSAEPSSRNGQGTIASTAHPSADMWLNEPSVQIVKSAGNLCDSCGIAIAQSLAAMQHGQSPELHLGPVSMPETKKSILIQSLALFAEILGSTGTTPTTASLSLLFGYVRHAIAESISKASPDPNTASAPTRFLYQSKADRAERNIGLDGVPERFVHDPEPNGRAWDIPGSHSKPQSNYHPTVKPIALMQWLVRLVTPPGGLVLDPFLGSGTTGIACDREGFNFIGIELSPEYAEISRRRLTGDAPLFAEVEVA